MLETRCIKIRLKPNMVDRARAWAKEVNTRRDEVDEVLRLEGVVIECAFLDQTAEGDFLVYFMKGTNLSTVPTSTPKPGSIEEYHQTFKREAWESGRRLETLVDLDLTGD